jgi:hypothetical protein
MDRMNWEAFLASGFLERHLLCGRPVWPEGRPPTWSELPALQRTTDVFDTFLELTYTCTVCRTSVLVTVDADDDPATWRATFDNLTDPVQ